MLVSLTPTYYRQILKEAEIVTLEHAVFRKEESFIHSNLKNFLPFWESEILKDHPHKHAILGWLSGVKIEEFLNSFTSTTFQGIKLNSYYPQQQHFENYVPAQFEQFMDEQVQEWVNLGVFQKWEDVKELSDPSAPIVVSPLGVEPNKPRAIWDGRYVNEFCRDICFHMDNASKVAEIAWDKAYFFKLDHKNGYLHIPIHKSSWKFFGVRWKGVYYVVTVLPFGWKSSPLIYHSVTEAVCMYIRSLGIPILCWIDDMLGTTEQIFRGEKDEAQFQSALRAMVVVSIVLFKAGYFLGISKCNLIPEQVMVYLGIECDSLHSRFLVPEKRIIKYMPLLQDFVTREWVSFADMERLVGKLVSLESAVPAGMWYTREQYSALRLSGVSSASRRAIKQAKYIKVSPQLREEWYMWIFFLSSNSGSPWNQYQKVLVQADISSDASGKAFAGVVNFVDGPFKITAGEFEESILDQDIQVKEGEALRRTLQMLVNEFPSQIQGKQVVCNIDNQVLKAVLERKGTSQNLALNQVGKQIYWLQQLGKFHMTLKYVKSEFNVADPFTRESPGLEAVLSTHVFQQIWEKWGPFQWDLMASKSNVQKDLKGNNLSFFSRYYDPLSKGVDILVQDLTFLQEMYCFPPIPMIGKLLKHFQAQKIKCVLILPLINSSWVNLVSEYIQDLMIVAKPFSGRAISVLNARGKRIPKKYPYAMAAVKMDFTSKSMALKQLHI